MNATLYVLGTLIFIIVSGIYLYPSTNLHPLIFGWIWFNIWIAIYETYIVLYRAQMKKYENLCENRPFWTTDSANKFWLTAWAEYTCHADKRYFDPNNLVFWIELGNAIIVFLLLILLFLGTLNNKLLIYILIIQAYHCFIYFLTWWKAKQDGDMHLKISFKTYAYLLLSAVWIVIPIILIYLLHTKQI